MGLIKKYSEEYAHLKIYHFDNLLGAEGIKHYVSTRNGGVSIGELGSLNLSFKVGDDPVLVTENRLRVADILGIEAKKLVFPVQTHSANIQVVNKDNYEDHFEDTDALITTEKGICISVMSADCVPVLLYDPVQKAIGAIHAGWKGTVSKIVEKTVKALQENFETDPRDLIAGIGPSISQEVYEVGPEVIEAVQKAFGTKEGLVINENADGKGFLNLWRANELQLLHSGLLRDNIEISGICTFQNSNIFFSARKSLNKAGRFAAGIMLTD